MSQRTDRIDELLRQEIGQALEREVADPAIGFVTVTDVQTTPDLSHAKVWFSVIGSEDQRRTTLAALRRAMPFVRRGLGSKLRLRRIPELDVRLDESVQRGTRVLQILSELEAGRTPEDEPVPDESLPTPLPRLPHEGDAPEPPELPAPGTEAGDAPAGAPSRARRRPQAGAGQGRDREAARHATGSSRPRKHGRR